MAELIIDVSDLLREVGKELEIKMSKEFSPLNLGTREVKFAKLVDLNLTLENVDSGVLAQGTVEGTLILQCNRCLKEFACPMKVKIEEIEFPNFHWESEPCEKNVLKPLLLQEPENLRFC